MLDRFKIWTDRQLSGGGWRWNRGRVLQLAVFVLSLLPAVILMISGYVRIQADLETTTLATAVVARDLRLVAIIYGTLFFFNILMAYLLLRLVQVTTAGQETEKEILDSVGDGVIATDKEGVVLYANKAAEQMLGWASRDLIGKKLSSDVPKAVDEKDHPIPLDQRATVKALTTKKRFQTGYYYVRKDGTKFFASVTAAPIITDEHLMGSVTVFRDQTREITLDRAKSEFVSLASHQMVSPLTSIRWFIELLLSDKKGGSLAPDQREALDEILSIDKNMIEIVKGLLNVARLELGTYTLDPTPVVLAELADSELRELDVRIREKDLVIERDYGDIRPVTADRGMLRIVMQNLISNAIKYTRKGGHVRVSIKPEGDHQVVTVVDNGVGIPLDQQPRIFEKMFRADNVRKSEGTGLGLYVAKAIVEVGGGKIWFKSEEGKGTTFHFTAPFSGMKKKIGTSHLA